MSTNEDCGEKLPFNDIRSIGDETITSNNSDIGSKLHFEVHRGEASIKPQ